MKKSEAEQLVINTFTHEFSEEQFTNFIRNLLHGLESPKTRTVPNAQLPQGFREHVTNYTRLGTYYDPKGDVLDVVIVKLKRKESLDRARTRQRNLMAHYLNKRGKDAVLVAYIADDLSDWRFSYVKLAYKTEITDEGMVGVKREFTPARRYSFLVGVHEPNHTAQKQLGDLLLQGGRLTLNQIEEAFNIESVTKEFFEDYKSLFLEIKENLDQILASNQKVKVEFERCRIDTTSLSKKLLGQIVFLYFLQKKGWLGVAEDEPWGTGDKQFLYHLFVNNRDKNYFDDILEPFFYEALAIERIDDFYPALQCKIPFLNGGLFEPLHGYEWKNTDINLNNEVFKKVFEVFNLYNFTVREDEPLEKEVAVDPEMLGKVFENLLEIKDRKGKGAFYTPREIVHYMCQESLINYLDSALNAESQKIAKEEIEGFIREGDLSIERDQAREDGNLQDGNYGLPESIREHAKEIDFALADVKICDPAIGSGAFPVGMMTEIVRARTVLTPYLSNQRSRDAYTFKWHCIESSLYGVDIDPSAVEIAKLRLWLSLVVDEESYDSIRPLPNLDYRIVCGDSLFSVQKDLFNYALYPELEKKKMQYFSTTSTKNKEALRNKIVDLIDQLTNGKRLFDFKVYFSEVYTYKNGFDIVIGNPPYLEARSKEFHKDLKDKLHDNVKKIAGNQSQFIPRGSDLLIYFFFTSLQLINQSGIVVKISQNSWLDTEYGRKFQKFLLLNTCVKYIIDSDFKYFDTANINTIISIFKGKKPCTNGEIVFVRYKIPYSEVGLFSAVELRNPEYVVCKKINSNSELLERLKWGTIHISDEDTFRIIQILDNKGKQISKVRGAFLSIGQGLNLQRKYIIPSDKIQKLGLAKSQVIPFITTSDAATFQVITTSHYLANGTKLNEKQKEILKGKGVEFFDPTSTTKSPPILIMPRGIGERHYCSINCVKGYSDSGVDIYSDISEPDEKILLNLWTFFNSSVFWLIREITGRKNLGGGMLKAEAVDIKYYPVYFNFPQTDEMLKVLNGLSLRTPLPISEEVFSAEHQIIDNIVFDYLKIPEVLRSNVKYKLVSLVDNRINKSNS